jgi:hypothetical protein
MIDFKTHTSMAIWKNQLSISVIGVFLDVLPLKKRDRHLPILIKL